MEKRLWHNYSGESADELLALAATHRVDSLAVAFEEALGRKAFKLGAHSLSVPERDVLAIEAMEREVNNGGFKQFFTNSSSEFASTLLEALRRVGCPQTAAITERALGALPPGVALTVEGLDAEMATANARRDEELDACDQAYFAAREDIAGALIGYLQRHRDNLRLL